MTRPRFKLKGDFYHGKFHHHTDGDLEITKTCPANTEDILWHAVMRHDHIQEVISSAREGHKTWAQTTQQQRIEYLLNLKKIFNERTSEIAQAIALETGKPLWESTGEAKALANLVDIVIEISHKKIMPQNYENIMPNAQGQITYKPIGPCFVIGPFNFPCHLANSQILNALLAGNSIIFKPSEKTILSAQILMECYAEARFPAGVVNFINGDAETVIRILKSKEVRGVFFTGSKEVGISILEKTYKDLNKMVALELGGKNTSIVHRDANIENALPELLQSAFLTSGQRCTSTAKILIHNSIFHEVAEKFHSLAKKIIIDHPIDHQKEPFMGPLIDEKAVENYLLYMGMASREGHEELMRGKALEKKYPGHYVTPSIHVVKNPREESRFFMDELFGPNCMLIPYSELEEAVSYTNMSEYGLSTAIYTQEKDHFEYAKQYVDSGILNWNRSTAGGCSKLPFGGIKNSGNYRPAGVSMIDSCAYAMTSLLNLKENSSLENVKGLNL